MKRCDFHSERVQRGLVLLLGAASLACAPAGRMGEGIHIAEESAIIIWDAATKTQHFIRRASFETKAKDFGFLVPTPTVPKLEEADDEAFGYLAWLTRPPVQKLRDDVKALRRMADKSETVAQVIVIATAKVAGYDATVLEATDANALDGWLKQHGYLSSPALVEWYKPYIAQKWKITAFKIATNTENTTSVKTSAIRMSFESDRPFFPYREPAVEAGSKAARMLRVYLLGDTRHDGRIGAEGKWQGKTVWSNRVTEGNRVSLMKRLKLPDDTARAALHLTEFEDVASPRPGNDDLFFRAATDQSPVSKPEVDDIGRPVRSAWEELAVVAGVLLGITVLVLLYRFLKRIFRRA